ncbi:MAG: Gfo/Idh/MocA family oxidoreductase [Rhodospirillales bacterium]|jgi:predicted dehydrogenase|nr:Gfo/Idh/MocA family oxidoreductase [Rhodospirillales bacterium]
MEPLKWGIISTAKIGRERVVPAMMKGEMTQFCAVASRDVAAAREYADELGIPKAYGSYEDLLADPEIEAIYNPLPNNLHVQWTINAAEAGKHVLCEKPIAMTAEEAQTLIAVRDRTGVRIEEAFMVRHHPQWIRARDLVRQGKIGRLGTVHAVFSYMNVDPNNIRNIPETGGGGIYDIGCYPIVVSRFIFGNEPTRAVSLVERDPEMKTDRLASAMLDFPEGQATFTCSTQLAKYQRVQILGTEGRIEVQIPYNAPDDVPCRIFLDSGIELGDVTAVAEDFDPVNQYTLQGDVFSRGVRDGTPPEFPLEDAIKNMRVIDAIFRSAETKAWEKV